MNERNPTSPLVAHEELEDLWRRKVEEVQERYLVAAERYKKSLRGSHGPMPAAGNNALALTRHEQSEACAEFGRILKIFTELTFRGQIPQEEPRGSTDGQNNDAHTTAGRRSHIPTQLRALKAALRVIAHAIAKVEQGEAVDAEGVLRRSASLLDEVENSLTALIREDQV